MDEESFDALTHLPPFGTEDAKRADFRYRRGIALAAILWGKTDEDLRRQLLTHPPETPSGFALADYREVQRTTEQLAAAMSRTGLESKTIVVGAERYTQWEARCEIIRRAIEYLENR